MAPATSWRSRCPRSSTDVADPVPAAGPRHGRVASFDPARGSARWPTSRARARVPRHRHRRRKSPDRGRDRRGASRWQPGHRGRYEARSAGAGVRAGGTRLPPPPTRPGVAAGEHLERGVHALPVAGGEEVEEQPARHRRARGGRGSGTSPGTPTAAATATLASSQPSRSSFNKGSVASSPWRARP